MLSAHDTDNYPQLSSCYFVLVMCQVTVYITKSQWLSLIGLTLVMCSISSSHGRLVTLNT